MHEKCRMGAPPATSSFFVTLAFQTFLKNGAYTKEGFEELITQAAFPYYEINQPAWHWLSGLAGQSLVHDDAH